MSLFLPAMSSFQSICFAISYPRRQHAYPWPSVDCLDQDSHVQTILRSFCVFVATVPIAVTVQATPRDTLGNVPFCPIKPNKMSGSPLGPHCLSVLKNCRLVCRDSKLACSKVSLSRPPFTWQPQRFPVNTRTPASPSIHFSSGGLQNSTTSTFSFCCC